MILAEAADERKSKARKVHLLAAGAVCFNAAGNCLLRAGLASAGPIEFLSPLDYLNVFSKLLVPLGVVVLVGWFVLQLSLLSCADLTYVLPVTAASYILIALVGALVLHERVSAAH